MGVEEPVSVLEHHEHGEAGHHTQQGDAHRQHSGLRGRQFK